MAGNIAVALIGWSSCDIACPTISPFFPLVIGVAVIAVLITRVISMVFLLFSVLFLSPILSDFCPLQMAFQNKNVKKKLQAGHRGTEGSLRLPSSYWQWLCIEVVMDL